MQQTINNLVCPFEMGLQNVSPGMMVTISGTGTGNRFTVNFKLGPGPSADVAFHTAVRFDERAVVRNNRTSGRWNTEERMTSSGMPIQRGTPFQAIFLVEHNKFKLAFNGQHFADFVHRVPHFKIQYLEISGNVNVTQLIIGTENAGYSQAPPPYSPPGVYPSAATPKKKAQRGATTNVINPALETPISIPFPNIRDHVVTITGTPFQGGQKRFAVNFCAPNGDWWFRLAGRMDERVVIRNSRMSGSWGTEERHLAQLYPFNYNQMFTMVISVSGECFHVMVNGVNICDFYHRKRPLTQIRHVTLSGCVSVSSLTFQ